MVNLIAISLSQVTNVKCRTEQRHRKRIDWLWKALISSVWEQLRSRQDSQAINEGCTVRPANASVTAKQPSKMLALFCNRGLLFTAMITNTLSRTVKGQEMQFIMIEMKLTSNVTFGVSPSVVVFVTFVKFDPVRLAMSRRKRREDRLKLEDRIVSF